MAFMRFSTTSRTIRHFAWLALALPALTFFTVRCDFGTVTGDPPKDTSGTQVGYATLTITNAFTYKPGVFEFNLYGPNALLVDNAAPVRKLGEVKEGASITVQIPKGTWKLGYVYEALAQPVGDLANTGVGWPRLAFADSGKYNLLMFTKEDERRNYITHDIPEVP